MSEIQLRRIQQENEARGAELARAKELMKVSDACDELIAYVTEHKDPFLPGYDFAANPNPWGDGGGGKDDGCCIIS